LKANLVNSLDTAALPREAPISKGRRAPPVPQAIKDAARRSLADWVATASQRFSRPLFMPTISFDLVGTTAGKAFYKQRHVQLNAVLLMENLEKFKERTIPHELAHLLVFHLHEFPGGHGKEWQAVMHTLGLEASRCHSYDVTNSRTTTQKDGYACGCGPSPVSARVHSKLQRGVTFTCSRCKKKLFRIGAAPSPTSVVPPRRAAGYGARPPTPAPARMPLPTPLPRSGRSPSEAMLRFATSLAQKHRMTVPQAVLADFETCRQFLDTWSKAPVTVAVPPPGHPPSLAFPLAATPSPGPASSPGVPEPPTVRQLEYAKSIALRKKLTLSSEVLTSKRAMSAWIDEHK
jgi:SprT protein